MAAVTSLNKIINETFVKTLTRVGSSSSASGASAARASLGSAQQVSISSGLRLGARDFAAAVQLINSGITVINVARAANEKLIDVVDRLDGLVDSALAGSMTQGRAKRLSNEFRAISRDFEKLLKSTAEQKLDVFNVDDLAGVLSRAGLSKENVEEIAGAFKKLTPLTESRIDSEGNVTSTAKLIPKDEFSRALLQGLPDPEDPLAEEPARSFTGVRSKIKKLRKSLEGNVKALEDTADVVSKNLNLVRVVGLAMLDLSGTVRSDASAADVAEELQARIRQGAPLLLGQAHNLQAIAVAGLNATKPQGGS